MELVPSKRRHYPIAGRAVLGVYWTLLNRVPGGNIAKN
jgi:hypothetical protein